MILYQFMMCLTILLELWITKIMEIVVANRNIYAMNCKQIFAQCNAIIYIKESLVFVLDSETIVNATITQGKP